MAIKGNQKAVIVHEEDWDELHILKRKNHAKSLADLIHKILKGEIKLGKNGKN